MEDTKNEEVLAQLGYSFDEAIEDGNIEEARAIISIVKDIDVFSAKVLEAELMDAPLSNFIHETDAKIWK